MYTNYETMDEVIFELDSIVNWCIESNCKAVIFAALYKEVTIGVKHKIIEKNYFDNNERMERLDIIFANRYLEAFRQYQGKMKMTKSWESAFSEVENEPLLILQHMLLGINAHINLDLGIASALTSPGNEITSLKNDFYKINRLLFDTLDIVQDKINSLSPWMAIIDFIGKRDDEKIMGFSIERARDYSWLLAEQLAPLKTAEHFYLINLRDEQAALFGKLLANPGWLLGVAAKIIKFREENDCRKIIEGLS